MSTPRSTTRAALGGAAAVGLVGFLRRRRGRLHQVASEVHDTVLPAGVDEPVREVTDAVGDGHAPGHRHLAPPVDSRAPASEGPHRRRYFVGDRSRQSRS